MPDFIIKKRIKNPIWVGISEAAILVGVQDKTIRRAIKEEDSGLKFQIIRDRYSVDLQSLINYMNKNTKLRNKLLENGLGQYVDKWAD